MTTKSKMYIVAYKEYAHGPKVLDDSKIFRVKQQARGYAAELQEDPKKYKQSGDQGWIVVELEAILD